MADKVNTWTVQCGFCHKSMTLDSVAKRADDLRKSRLRWYERNGWTFATNKTPYPLFRCKDCTAAGVGVTHDRAVHGWQCPGNKWEATK